MTDDIFTDKEFNELQEKQQIQECNKELNLIILLSKLVLSISFYLICLITGLTMVKYEIIF